MQQRIIAVAEQLVFKRALSRRGLLMRAIGVALGAMVAAGAISGLGGASSEAATARDRGDTMGACYYTVGGTPRCQQLTHAECAAINGSTFAAGQSCGLARLPQPTELDD